MVIYTKKGDFGQTSLPGGVKLSKGQPIFEVLGNIDEINACLGICRSLNVKKYRNLNDDLDQIQSAILNIGAVLADPNRQFNLLKEVEETTLNMESRLSQWEHELSKLNNFILPGGILLSSQFHLCRTIARRAERSLNRIYLDKGLNSVSVFLNRLSDYCFQAARWVNHQEHLIEKEWKNKSEYSSDKELDTF